MAFWIFITCIIGIRLGECLLARRNERWLLQQGAVEYGQRHYPFMIALHTCFIVSMIVEYILRGGTSYSLSWGIIFLLLLICKGWVIATLGKFWNTKIYRAPRFSLIKAGPYKYVKHPNYLIVIAEIAVIPLIFHLYYTAVVFSVLNLCMLYVRVKVENKALRM